MRRSIVGLVLLVGLLLAPRAAHAQDNPLSSCPPSDASAAKFRSMVPEPVPGRPEATRIRLTGDVELPCGDMTLRADEVVYDKTTSTLVATGHVHLDQKDLSLYADRAELHRDTKLGTFYHARGFAQLGSKPEQRSLFGTMEPDVFFWGEEISKTGPTTYQLVDGGFTTCVQPSRRWAMTSGKGTITLDKSVLMRNVLLRVKDVPLLYLPAIYYPINKEDRSTGFLLPQYGASTLNGSSLSNAFFLVLGRSQDATFYHDWFSKGGQGFGSEYRYVASPGSQGRANFLLRDQSEVLDTDGSVISEARRSYSIDGDFNQALPHFFRLYGRARLFTDIALQQQYQGVNDFSQRDRSFSGTVSGSVGRYRLAAGVEQSDYFYGFAPGQRIGKLPSVSVSAGDKPIGKSKVYFGAFGESVYLVRQGDLTDPTTDQSVWRFDGGPSVRAPLSTLPYLSATGAASWRITRWQETYSPLTGDLVPVALTRQLFELRGDLVGPVFARVFQTPDNGYASRFKHLIEPGFSIRRTVPYRNIDSLIVKNDYTDSLVGGNTTLNYRLTNRLMARRRSPGAAPDAPGIIREILSVDIGQTYYTNPLAANSDPYYSQTGTSAKPSSTGTFSPIQMTAISRPTDETSGQLRLEVDSKYRALRGISASGALDSAHSRITAGWSRRMVIEGSPDFTADRASNYLNASTTVHARDNRLGGSYDFNYDLRNGGFLQQRLIAYYNSQCCGVSIDWQSISTPLLSVQSDRRLGISFTLAGIGSFSNPLGSFGGK